MVCECARSAPLSPFTYLERGTTPNAVRIRHDKPGPAPDDPGATSALTASNFDYGLPEQLTHAGEI
jgi:hypothetical protein